jgi:hypothetical protein
MSETRFDHSSSEFMATFWRDARQNICAALVVDWRDWLDPE